MRCSTPCRQGSSKRLPTRPRWRALPIVTVNLWFDSAVMQEPLVGLPGRNFQWVFDRRAIVGGDASHLSLISSGAETIVSQTNDALDGAALVEVREALPAARSAKLRKSLAVREKRSTFSLAPDAPPRPGTQTSVDGFLLAGDWIDTGLPATIESAVMSGHMRAAPGGTETLSVVPLTKCRAPCLRRIDDFDPRHYSEVALKGKNRSWFVGRLVRQIHGALAGLHVKEVRTHIGRIEIVLGQDSMRFRKCAIACRESSASPTTRWPRICRSISRAWPRDRRRNCRRRKRPKQFSRARSPRRPEVRDAVARSRARSRIARVARARLEGRSRSRRPRDPRRDRARLRVLLRGPRPGRRRAADRHRRPAGRAVVRRHRFAGGGVAHDEARLQRHARALPQRAVPVEHVAGKGETARRGADALPAANRSCISCRSASCSGRSR